MCTNKNDYSIPSCLFFGLGVCANTYVEDSEMIDTQTTSRSSRLKADRQNEPGCSTKPYETSFSSSSIVKMVVKK